MRVLGVDGCRQGWIGVVLDSGRVVGVLFEERLSELLSRAPEAECVGVDMPIGLVEESWREADLAARAFLGRRAATVFMVPPRPVLLAEDHAAASELSRALTGQGVSRQAFNLRSKILEVDPLAASDTRLHEVHPEVAFGCMAGGFAVSASKKTWEGVARRLALLEASGIRLPAEVGLAGRAAPDDVLDAAAVAWSASRIVAGQALSLPEHTEQRMADGRPISIWA